MRPNTLSATGPLDGYGISIKNPFDMEDQLSGRHQVLEALKEACASLSAEELAEVAGLPAWRVRQACGRTSPARNGGHPLRGTATAEYLIQLSSVLIVGADDAVAAAR